MKIKSSSQTRWENSQEVVKQPTGIDYNKLSDKLSSVPQPTPSPSHNHEKEIQVLDLRKDINKKKFEDLDIEDPTNAIDPKSIIPVPGLAIPTENSESGWKPPTSDWIAPHGPQWGPMTQ